MTSVWPLRTSGSGWLVSYPPSCTHCLDTRALNHIVVECVWGKNASAGRAEPAAWMAWRMPYKPLIAPREELEAGGGGGGGGGGAPRSSSGEGHRARGDDAEGAARGDDAEGAARGDDAEGAQPLPPRWLTVAMVREPVSRFVSGYLEAGVTRRRVTTTSRPPQDSIIQWHHNDITPTVIVSSASSSSSAKRPSSSSPSARGTHTNARRRGRERGGASASARARANL